MDKQMKQYRGKHYGGTLSKWTKPVIVKDYVPAKSYDGLFWIVSIIVLAVLGYAIHLAM